LPVKLGARSDQSRWRFPRRWVGFALAMLLVIAPVLAARAAEVKANPWAVADGAEDAAYQEAIRAGVAEYDAGHFEEARSLFRRAHGVQPNARTFRGVGMASFELRDYVAAVHNLTAALEDERKPLSPDQRKDAQDLLARSRMFVDTYTVEVVPDSARLTVDGHVPEFEPDGTMLLGFGVHWLEARAPGMATLSRSIDVRGGARRELRLSLEPAPAKNPKPSADGIPTATAAGKAPSPRPSQGAAAAWLWASVGAALLASGAGYYWYRQNDEIDSCRNPMDGLRCTNESTLVAQRNFGMAATLGIGAVAVTMALVGILTWHRRSPPDRRSGTLACGASRFGVTCGSSF
jgi:hypothetical protein